MPSADDLPSGGRILSHGLGSLFGRVLPALTLLLILAATLWSFNRLQPIHLFGQFHDDTVFMSTAQALAAGSGYRLPSIPQTPVQTKHPIFYPWLLSLVWHWNPDFPANLWGAVTVSAAFTCLALLASYLLLRSLGVAIPLALGITGFCGLHPAFLQVATRVMSDVSMMALMLAAAVLAERALRPRGSLPLAGIAGLLTAMAVLTRTIGISIILGVLVAGVVRKQYRATSVFLIICLPLTAVGMLWPGDNQSLQPWVEQGDAGFRQTWLYYTSYLGFWEHIVPDLQVFSAMVGKNALMFVINLAMYFLFFPIGGSGSMIGAVFFFVISGGILAGILRQGRQQGWKVIHFVFPFYATALLVWSHGDYMLRFCLPFLPLFCLGLWTEGRHVVCLAAATLRTAKPFLDKAVAAGMLAALGLLSLQVAAAYWENKDLVIQLSAQRALITEEKMEVYAWIRTHTNPSARFISSDDVELYLHTGRQAMRPIAFSREPFYTGDRRILERDLEHIFDTAQHIGATYWVSAEFDFTWLAHRREVQTRVRKLLQGLPIVFQSTGGRIELYDISSRLAQGSQGPGSDNSTF